MSAESHAADTDYGMPCRAQGQSRMNRPYCSGTLETAATANARALTLTLFILQRGITVPATLLRSHLLLFLHFTVGTYGYALRTWYKNQDDD